MKINLENLDPLCQIGIGEIVIIAGIVLIETVVIVVKR